MLLPDCIILQVSSRAKLSKRTKTGYSRDAQSPAKRARVRGGGRRSSGASPPTPSSLIRRRRQPTRTTSRPQKRRSGGYWATKTWFDLLPNLVRPSAHVSNPYALDLPGATCKRCDGNHQANRWTVRNTNTKHPLTTTRFPLLTFGMLSSSAQSDDAPSTSTLHPVNFDLVALLSSFDKVPLPSQARNTEDQENLRAQDTLSPKRKPSLAKLPPRKRTKMGIAPGLDLG